MRKILVIEDWKEKKRETWKIFMAFMPNLFGDCAPYAYKELFNEVLGRFLKSEPKDVLEFKAEVETETTPDSMPGRDFIRQRTMIRIPNEFADGEELIVFAIKKAEGKDAGFSKMS